MSLEEVVREEKETVLPKYPHLQAVYDRLTRTTYQKMLRNRMQALKSRLKKKSEDRELESLRELARRVFQLNKHDHLPKETFELLRLDSDQDFAKLASLLSQSQSRVAEASPVGMTSHSEVSSRSHKRLHQLLHSSRSKSDSKPQFINCECSG